jgi:hypothetical protein
MHLPNLRVVGRARFVAAFFIWFHPALAIQIRFPKEVNMKFGRTKPVAVAIILLFCSAAFGGTIQGTPAPVASGTGLGFATVAAVVTVQANNDNVPSPNFTDANLVVPFKRFDNPDFIDIEFRVLASDGVTEYQVNEFVDNNTGVPWGNYRMVLGFGTGANFVISPLGDGLDFDFPNYDTSPTSGAFPTVLTPDEDQLIFTGGTHAAGAQPYSVRIDVPDLSGRQTPTFTLREIPIVVPEPRTSLLASVAALGLVMRRRND